MLAIVSNANQSIAENLDNPGELLIDFLTYRLIILFRELAQF